MIPPIISGKGEVQATLWGTPPAPKQVETGSPKPRPQAPRGEGEQGISITESREEIAGMQNYEKGLCDEEIYIFK